VSVVDRLDGYCEHLFNIVQLHSPVRGFGAQCSEVVKNFISLLLLILLKVFINC